MTDIIDIESINHILSHLLASVWEHNWPLLTKNNGAGEREIVRNDVIENLGRMPPDTADDILVGRSYPIQMSGV